VLACSKVNDLSNAEATNLIGNYHSLIKFLNGLLWVADNGHYESKNWYATCEYLYRRLADVYISGRPKKRRGIAPVLSE
jgi:hypothetical protein